MRSVVLAIAFLLCAAEPGGAQARPIVVIDPGHGGAEAGVVEGELVEKDLVLRMAFAIAAEFVKRDFDVRLTRSGDYAVPWADRRAFAENAGAAVLLMLHLNRDTTGTRHGAELYAHLDNAASARAAEALAAALRQSGSAAVVEGRPWPFLQSPTVPTVMIELAFMTHPVERRLIELEAFHQLLAQALAQGVAAFLPGSRP